MAKRHFLSPKEKAELGMIKSKPTPQKGSPEYKIQKLQSTTWLLLVASFVAVILGIAITWSIGYSPALGFAKLKPVFWMPLLFSMIPLTLVVFSIILSTKKGHYLLQLILGIIAIIILVIATVFYGLVSIAYSKDYSQVTYAESTTGIDLNIDKENAYTLDMTGITNVKVTYYQRERSFNLDVPGGGNNNFQFLLDCNVPLNDIPVTRSYYSCAIYNATTGEWYQHNNYNKMPSGQYTLIVIIESSFGEAGILLTNVNVTVY